ncbi:MAG TPA: hypothetical protein VFG20_02530 [Planctomycetaceae bacterium]|nr:hypothetical protein [Planctomycetaceae bacterium]
MAQQSNQAASAAKDASTKLNDVATQLGGALKDAASQAYESTTQKADDLAANLGGSIRQFGDRIKENSPGGMLAGASEAVADRVKWGGEYLEQAKFSGASDDLAELIQRNPIPAVLIAFGVGWFLSRRI